MKKVDKIVLKAFFGPFFITLAVVIFIFLMQYLIKYFEDFVGKGLGIEVYGQLIFYFSINVIPVSLPLAILISTLITYGNLGEHSELTAIKGAGISLLRTLRPICLFSLFMCLAAFFINNNVVPKANLHAFSLLYDVKKKKPSLEFKEGAFYNGIPKYSIKVEKKTNEGKILKDVMIYDHTANKGNTDLILAKSGKMSSFYNNKYLKLELFNGNSYSEIKEQKKQEQFVRSRFDSSQIIFDLSSFDLKRTKKELFKGNKIMRNVSELSHDIDSLEHKKNSLKHKVLHNSKPFYSYVFKDIDIPDSVMQAIAMPATQTTGEKKEILKYATNTARSIKNFIGSYEKRILKNERETNEFAIEFHKKFAQSFACLVMFLIGAPLGAIIKKGGLGVPVLISIIFFIIYYILSTLSEKWAKQDMIPVDWGMWLSNITLLVFGLFFLYQAKSDSRILESDFFVTIWDRLKQKFKKK